jgi:hypothetical protein
MKTYSKRRNLKQLEKWGLCAGCNTLTWRYNEAAQLHLCNARCMKKYKEGSPKQ